MTLYDKYNKELDDSVRELEDFAREDRRRRFYILIKRLAWTVGICGLLMIGVYNLAPYIGW